MTLFLWIIAVIFILTGIAGTVLPMAPGAPLVFAGLWLAAWADHYGRVGGLIIVVLGILTLLSFGVEIAAATLGARHVRASRQAIIGSVIGTLVGLFTGFLGLVVGPFIGAFIGEFIARRDLYQAGQVGLGTWIGILLGTAFKLGLSLLMLGIFITAYLWK